MDYVILPVVEISIDKIQAADTKQLRTLKYQAKQYIRWVDRSKGRRGTDYNVARALLALATAELKRRK